MLFRVSNVRLPVEEPETALPQHLSRALGVPAGELARWRIVRKALDLRDKRQLQFVYNLEIDIPEAIPKAVPPVHVEAVADPPFTMPAPGSAPLRQRPIVVGSGPGGLVCAYFLAQMGYRPIVLERGTKVSDRIRDVQRFDAGGPFHPESNYLFGEGGAGTFSDGKLTCRSTGPDVMRVLELLAECKGQQPGKPSILYYHRPHLGSNRLPAVVKALRQRIEEFGGEVRFLTRVEDLHIRAGQLQGVTTSSGFLPASVVVLAIGHSARDTYRMLAARGVPLSPKPFQFGVRIEHPQELVNAVQFGPRHDYYEQQLGNADYSLVAHGHHDLFTFCMCAGGYIIPSVSQEGYFATNGMSLSKRDSPYANSGLVVTVPTEAFEGNDVLAGVRLQEHYEAIAYTLGGHGEYRCPVQRATDFLAQRVSRSAPTTSYPRGVAACDLRAVLPPLVIEALMEGLPQMDRRWQGRFLASAVLAGPESRGSSPVRIDRDNHTRESPGVSGLYPVGEGAGYAGGIVSAAVDGLRTAKAIIAKYSPVE
ncbi:MAG: NAD(P)-binding protein [Gemmataceae bacterium]|nr:NAD(P)-binding protein [Gemmata sp.]MDW8197550.1 NAD(P)-binding protein [Gemmataceae bacterium]